MQEGFDLGVTDGFGYVMPNAIVNPAGLVSITLKF